ncbi:MAG: acyl-ACP--UDP-N-acetylglucosamine O-acyltransferase [Bacteroidales bacterium]|nr:acyl-ACP--UDP-N-acetylglucosamine O-acyltransferase [Bacteroidales bacterium]
MIGNNCNIHPLSIIAEGAKIGDNVTVGPFTKIDDNVVIGDGCNIMNGVTIFSGTRMGQNCRVFPNAVIGAIPQDLKFRGEETTCEIGDNNTIRECVTINRGTASRGKTVVGNGNLLMAYVHIGHDCVFGNNIIVSNACQFAGEVEVNDFAVIGGGSLVHQFTRVGRYVMVQGGTRFGKDIPPYVMIGREPAAFEGLNLIGLKRRGFTTAQIGEAQEVYKYLYQSGLNTTQALEAIAANMERTELVGEIVDFVKSSQRGIIRG